MSEFDDLISKLIEQKPELTRDEIQAKINSKKEKIGAGYLSDSGALFLVASDYGITLAEQPKVEMEIKDLYAGAKEISLEVRVLSMSPIKQFSKKDGSPLYLRTMTVYDSNSTASVKLWNEKASLPGIEELKPGDLIKIVKAYVKSDLDSTPTINIGSNSNIEAVDSPSEIPTIDGITKDLSEIKGVEKDLAIFGKIDGIVSEMRFTNSRGQPGKALRMKLKGGDGSSMRVVLWGRDETAIPNMISQDAVVRLLGVKTKDGRQGLEIHGDDATLIQVEGAKEAGPVIVRVLSIAPAENGRNLILGVDSKKSLFNISDSSNVTGAIAGGDVIECMPSKAYGNSISLDENSFVRKLDDDSAIPRLPQIRTKIDGVKMDEICCIEAIVIKLSERREIQTKTGDSVSLSEMYVEDETGHIWVKGWRNQARLIDKCELGEIVSITGVNTKAGLEGRKELVLTAFSNITKKS